jgi:hypothetical protein
VLIKTATHHTEETGIYNHQALLCPDNQGPSIFFIRETPSSIFATAFHQYPIA